MIDLKQPLGGSIPMTGVLAALRRIVATPRADVAVNNARREQAEHARIAIEVDALAQRIARQTLASRALPRTPRADQAA